MFEKCEAIDRNHKGISVKKQCVLLKLSRSSCYYKAKETSTRDLNIMRLIDKEFTSHPFFGSRRLSDWLAEQSFPACRSKVSRLMKVMGIEAIYPRKSFSARQEHIIEIGIIKQYIDLLTKQTATLLISKKDFSVIVFSFPKTKAEQTRIAQILSNMDSEIETLQKKLIKYKQMK